LTKNLDTTLQGSPPQLAAALDTLPGGTPLELRDQALAEMAGELGLCAEELVNLDVVDIDVEAGEVRVAGRGPDSDIVVAGAPVRRAVEHWLARGRAVLVQGAGERALFVSRSGRRLSNSDVRRRLRAVARRAALDLPVQDVAGRATLTTTPPYTRVESRRLRKAYARAHPRA
jgi:integrase/recombinase XerC/integrase/recombinase XerD